MLADRQIYRPTDKHHNNLFPYLGESRVINTRCKAKPDGSPPAYPPPPVNYWSVNWYACVQRSTCTSCRIPSHVNPTLRIIAEIELPWHGLLAWSTINARRRCSVVVLVRWRRRPSESHVYYPHSTQLARNWLPRQRPSRDRKGNFRSFMYSHISTVSANSVKISTVDVEIICLTEITKK